MGATNQIKGTNLSLQLAGKECPQCEQKFTQEEIKNENYEVWFDTTNDVKLIEMKEIESKFDQSRLEQFNDQYFNLLYYPFGRTGYQFSIWIRSIEHETCPDTEKCQGCDKQFLVEKMINPKGNFDYYCSPCHLEIKTNGV